MIKILSKILFKLSSLSILPPPKNFQKEIILKALIRHKDKDVLLRNSLMQYDCHRHYFLKYVWFSFQLFSLFLIFPLVLLLSFRSLFIKKNVNTSFEQISLFSKVPKNILKLHPIVYVFKPFGVLRFKDLKFIRKIFFISGFRPYFWLRCIWKMAVYRQLIEFYSPKSIWVTQEMVFESSFLTYFLREQNVKHVNFMHGEDYFTFQIAFCSFDVFYIWDSYYKKLFDSLYMDIAEYKYFSPIDRYESSIPQRNIIKYYNQESVDEDYFIKIMNNLKQYSISHGCLVSVRLHPLHQKEYERKIVLKFGFELEDHAIDIVDSILESKFVCSEFSSVLYYASLLKRDLIIDNTFPERLRLISDLEPIFLTKLKHQYLV